MEIKQGDNVSILATLWLPVKINRAENQMINSSMQYPKGDLNPHSCNSQRILSPSCLPFHHSGSLRAKNGTRTRDPNLGKVVLYQLSYFRLSKFQFILLERYPNRERKTGLEPATPTLARLCSTN